MSIHPTAIISPDAEIGKDVDIGAFAMIGPSTKIGDRCRIASHSTIEHTQLGNECVVYPYAALGLTPQHLGYKQEKTTLIVGDRCIFREGFTAHRGTLYEKGVTSIGSDGFFMAYSHVAHDCVVGNNVIMANGVQLAGHVRVGNRCFISGLAAIHQFCRIGDGAIVSGGSMVTLDVAPYCIAQGDRACLKGLNIVGLRRSGLSRESIKNLKAAYKTMFLSRLTLTEALAHPSLSVSDPAVMIFKEFLSTPKRGFVRPGKLIESLDEANS